MGRRLPFTAFFCLLAAWAPNTQAQSNATFTEQILPLLREEFALLLEREKGLDLSSWESLMKGSDFGEIVVPFDAEGSLIIKLATRLDSSDSLRPYAEALSEADIATVRDWIDDGARNDLGQVPFADSRNLLYAANEDAATVSVIDMDAQVVIRNIRLEALGFTKDAKPHHIAVEPDGSTWYVSLIGDDVILKFNRDNELVDQVSFERPGMLALYRGNNQLFVGRSMKAVNPPQRIGQVDRSSMELEELDVFFPRPHALAVHPEGNHVYVGSLSENRMATLEPAVEGISLTSIDGPTHTLVQFAIAPDGQSMVVGGQLTGKLFFFDTSAPENPTLIETIDVGAAPWHPVFSPDGSTVWFGNKMAGTATVVNLEQRTVVKIVEGLAQPHGSAMRSDGKYVFISNNNMNGKYSARYNFGYNPGVVVVINTETFEVEKMLEIGPNATGLGTAAL